MTTTYHAVEADMLPLAFASSDLHRSFCDSLNMVPGLRTDVPELAWHYDEPGSPDWASTIERTRLVSARTRKVLEPLLSPADSVQWLPATLTTSGGECLTYWVMHFPAAFDPYDPVATVRGPSGLAMPGTEVLSAARIAGHEIFAPPQQVDTVFVTERVINAMRDNGLTGWIAELMPTTA
ncbi:hypothetical protein GXP71_00440 [Cellulomonas sp. H30R-01]|uniref:hypothetical protein n=1 Tax=Cellulomonas sp. H30R-01 TaxID=2704467 RepID=UPI00138C8C2E|nr:hypothetical protein [Cellulomonas sp. H30R-01]QHT54718.1 hypothetical protein GXP71_00440 [Cellulomonas sp. H30R-01]